MEKGAVVFQKITLGFLQGGSDGGEYKGLLPRIQKRVNIMRPQTPFVLDDVSRFLDRKESTASSCLVVLQRDNCI